MNRHALDVPYSAQILNRLTDFKRKKTNYYVQEKFVSRHGRRVQKITLPWRRNKKDIKDYE